MEIIACDHCGEMSDNVDQVGLLRLYPRHPSGYHEERAARHRVVKLNADGKYERDFNSLEVIDLNACIDLCPKCVEKALIAFYNMRRLKTVIPRVERA